MAYLLNDGVPPPHYTETEIFPNVYAGISEDPMSINEFLHPFDGEGNFIYDSKQGGFPSVFILRERALDLKSFLIENLEFCLTTNDDNGC